MKLVSAELLLEIDIEENMPAVLVLENPQVMAEVVEQLYNLCLSQEGSFVLSEDNKILSIEKAAEIIINPYSIDFNSRKIQTKLYSELMDAESLYVDQRASIQMLIIDYLDKLSQSVPYEMITNDLDIDSTRLFKMLDVRVEPQCDSLLERMIEFSKIIGRLLKKKLMIFVNLQSFLSTDEIGRLNEICNYQKLKVLYVENYEPSFHFSTKTYIVDRDKCLIIK